MKVTEYSKLEQINLQKVSQIEVKKVQKSADGHVVQAHDQHDVIIEESPLEIRIKTSNDQLHKVVAITMRTPGHDKELVIGFLLTEGIIQSLDEIISIDQQSDTFFSLSLSKKRVPDLDKISRNLYTNSSCGICSKQSMESLQIDSIYLPWSSRSKFDIEVLFDIQRVFQSDAKLFHQTGGNHAVALINTEGVCLSLYEDVGRHNAMDKLVGGILLQNQQPLTEKFIALSGRISFELVQKASMVGTPLIVALGAPSSLAVKEAREQGICLVGFTKKQSLNIYTISERINYEK